MNKKLSIKNTLLAFSAVSAVGLGIAGVTLGAVSLQRTNKEIHLNNILEEIKVFSTNDIHGRLTGSDFAGSAGIESLAGYIQANPHDLLLDGGDLIQGQALNDVDKGRTIAKIASEMEYDGIAVGNHEFDFGLDNIVDIASLPGVNFLSSNTRYRQKDSNGNPTDKPDEHVFIPSRIVSMDNGLKAGIIGLTTLDTAFKTHPNNVKDVMFTDLVAETETQIKLLESQGIELIIVVSHVGAVRDEKNGSTVQLAEALPGKIDLIVDGHTQVSYNEEVVNPLGNTQIIQTGEYTESLRETNFLFNKETGQIENFVSTELPLEVIAGYENFANSNIRNSINDLKKMEGTINDVLVIDNAPIVTSNENGRLIERPMPNMVADANLAAANGVTIPQNLHADLAIMNTGGIRVSMPQGTLLRRNIFEVLPFGNQLRIVELPGSILQEVMEFSIKQQGDGSFLSLSDSVKLNITAKTLPPVGLLPSLIDQTKPIKVEVQLKNKLGVFENIVPTQIYKLATNDFLLAGGDGYEMLNLSIPEVSAAIKVIAEQGDMLTSLIDYVKLLSSTPEGLAKWSSTYNIDAPPTRILINNNASIISN